MALENWKEIEEQIAASGAYKNDDVKDKVKGRCHFCGVELDSDYYCYGCKEFICGVCDNCASTVYPCGPHKVKDHRHPVLDKIFGQGQT